MRIAILTDSIEKDPISIGKYTENFVRNLLKIKDKKLEIILIHGRKVTVISIKRQMKSYFHISRLSYILQALPISFS